MLFPVQAVTKDTCTIIDGTINLQWVMCMGDDMPLENGQATTDVRFITGDRCRIVGAYADVEKQITIAYPHMPLTPTRLAGKALTEAKST